MRVTNSMISNASQTHIANAKNKVMIGENQYTTQKKIQRPSDDPVVAVRALKLRTAYAHVQQFEKNVGDAINWMGTAEKALESIDSIFTDMLGLLNQGANDDLDAKQRNSVLATLKKYTEGVFEDNANKDYSGRYMFTGYRTDTSLLFPEHTDNLQYKITQNLNGNNINAIKVVSGGARYDDTKTAADYAKEVPKETNAYCMQLAYDNCVEPDAAATPPVTFSLSITDKVGTAGTQNLTVVSLPSDDPNAYNIEEYNKTANPQADAIFIYDKGEIVFSDATYSRIQAQEAEITVNYEKHEFDKGDIRPEMYFECQSYNVTSFKTTQYADPSGQEIRYEVDFSQTAVVNTQAKDAIGTDIYRIVDYIERMVTNANDVDDQISEIDKKIANTEETDPKLADYKKLKEMLETEQNLYKGAMTQAFGMGITTIQKAQDDINVAIADVGTRYDRLEMTSEKLMDDKVDTREKMSDNEDIDIADAYMNMTQAYDLYTAALSATSKILGNSLLNYI